MYHHLEGKLIEKTPTSIILDVQGVGYQVFIPVSTYSPLGPLGRTVRVLTHFLVREDAQQLYGFLTDEERDLFRMFISVSGVGPKVALTALSGMSIQELKHAIVEGSIAVLTGIPGIGKKTAERLIVELKEKITVTELKREPRQTVTVTEDSRTEDALQALISLGYKKGSAKTAVEKVLKETRGKVSNVEDLIRGALRHV